MKVSKRYLTPGEAEAASYGLARNLSPHVIASILDVPTDLIRTVEASLNHLRIRTKYVETVMAEVLEIRNETDAANKEKFGHTGSHSFQAAVKQ